MWLSCTRYWRFAAIRGFGGLEIASARHDPSFPLPLTRTWPETLPVYDHRGLEIEIVDIRRAEYLLSTGEYATNGTRKRVQMLCRLPPPDERTLPGRIPSGTPSVMSYRQKLGDPGNYEGHRTWAFKGCPV